MGVWQAAGGSSSAVGDYLWPYVIINVVRTHNTRSYSAGCSVSVCACLCLSLEVASSSLCALCVCLVVL